MRKGNEQGTDLGDWINVPENFNDQKLNYQLFNNLGTRRGDKQQQHGERVKVPAIELIVKRTGTGNPNKHDT